MDASGSLEGLIVLEAAQLFDHLDVPLDPWLVLASELTVDLVELRHQGALNSCPGHPVPALYRIDLLGVRVSHRCRVALLVFQRGRIELIGGACFNEALEMSHHLLEVAGQSLLREHILEVLEAILQVIEIGGSVLIVLPEQRSAGDQRDSGLHELRLDFWLVWVLVQLDEALVDVSAHPESNDSDGVVQGLEVLVLLLLD